MGNSAVLIDTSTIIKHLRSKEEEKTNFEKAMENYEVCYISSITVFEIEFGAIMAGRLSDLEGIFPIVSVVPFGKIESEIAAKIHSNLIKRNLSINIKDTFIAGTCIAQNLPLLTDNYEHFERVEGIKLIKM